MEEMNCQRIKEYLYQFIDGQLDTTNSMLVKEHISICPLCELEWKREKEMDSLIRRTIPKENAHFALKERIINRIEEFKKTKVFSPTGLKPILAVTSVALLLVIVSTVVKETRTFPIFTEAISSHIKFLQGGLPIEITSSNPQDIKDWFQGKIDFAIMVPDLSSKGIHLIGGRICHLKDRKVAYLMYEKDSYVISVFVIDTKGLNIPRAESIDLGNKKVFIKSESGYQSILCLKRGSDIGCIFVSELPEDELVKIIA